MADRPIIFSAPMVRALLDGRKTQTRRLLNPAPATFLVGGAECNVEAVHVQGEALPRIATGAVLTVQKLPFAMGDRAYVREAFRVNYDANWYDEKLGRAPKPKEMDPATTSVEFLADGMRELGGQGYPSIHMPRWASRLTLFVEEVRVQRLQDISEEDAIAEGVRRLCDDPKYDTGPNHFTVETGGLVGGSLNAPTARETFALLWDCLHEHPGTRWEDNPWIYALTFRVARGNIDQLEQAA